MHNWDLMPKITAGILSYTIVDGQVEVFLIRPGGPLYAHKSEGHWGIPKGEIDWNEDMLDCARREFQEETGMDISHVDSSEFYYLGSIKYKSGRTVNAWAYYDADKRMSFVESNLFEMEYPKGSGKIGMYPEICEGRYVTIRESKKLMKKEQQGLVENLLFKIDLDNNL